MPSAIEKSESKKDLEGICQGISCHAHKSPLLFYPRLQGSFTGSTAKHYTQSANQKQRQSLLRYETEAELMGYCKKKGFGFVAFVSSDGKGRMVEVC